jgi:hypothetical protein
MIAAFAVFGVALQLQNAALDQQQRPIPNPLRVCDRLSQMARHGLADAATCS